MSPNPQQSFLRDRYDDLASPTAYPGSRGEVRVARTQMSVTGDEALLIIIHTVSRPLDPRAVGLTVRRQSKFTPLHLLLQPLIALNSLYS